MSFTLPSPPATGKVSRRTSAMAAGRSGGVSPTGSAGSSPRNSRPSSPSPRGSGQSTSPRPSFNTPTANKNSNVNTSITSPSNDIGALGFLFDERTRADSNVYPHTQPFTVQLVNDHNSQSDAFDLSKLGQNINNNNNNNNNRNSLNKSNPVSPNKRASNIQKKPQQPEPEEEEEDDEDEDEDDEDNSSNSDNEEDEKFVIETKDGGPKRRMTLEEMANTQQSSLAQPNTPSNKNQNLPNGSVLLKVDLLAYLQKGTSFLKHCRRGDPHFRLFQLSPSNTHITWYSKSKNLSESTIELSSVNALVLGQQTPTFLRQPAPELEKVSFSLYYAQRKKSLDLIATDPNDYSIWIEALKQLIQQQQSGKDVASLKTLVATLPIVAGKPSSPNIQDVDTKKTANQLVNPDNPVFQRKSQMNGTSGEKFREKEMQKEISEVKSRLSRRRGELAGDSKYASSLTYENMISLIHSVEAALVNVDNFFADGDFDDCKHALWRASVDLESLKNMMKAV